MWGKVRVGVLDAPAVVADLEAAARSRQGSYAIDHVASLGALLELLEDAEPPFAVVTEYRLDEPQTALGAFDGDPEREPGSDGSPPPSGRGSAASDADMGGLGVVRRVRETAAVPVVVYTDDGSETVAATASIAGACGYVPKAATDAPGLVLEAVRTGVEDGASGAGRTREKIETLHAVAADLEACETSEELYERTIEAAEQVLEFDQCLLDVRRGEELVPVATSSGLPEGGAQSTPIDGENVAARVARTREASISNDLSEVTDADPEEMTYKSGFTVPVSDVGVFQAVSEELAAFDEDDVELAQLLASHVAEALKRIRSRAQLRDERDRFAALFENVPDPSVRARFVDASEPPVIERVNGAFARTFGCTSAGAEGCSLRSIVAPPSSTREVEEGHTGEIDEVYADADGGQEVVAREVRREAVDGVRDFILHVIPVHGREGEVYGIYTDITTTKERERELSRQNERLDDFASVVSHDLRNPLNVASGHLELYRETDDAVALDEVEHAHGRMRSLIEDLLELARSGEVVADAVGVDLGATARDAWSTLDTTDGEIDVVDTMQVTADRDRLRDVLVNLFRNGMEHNDTRDTPVAIEVGSLDDAAGFYVADDGEGIPPAERESVFETGYTNAEDGTGFGLAIVSEVTQAHGWSVSITDADGGGARFEFRGVETPH